MKPDCRAPDGARKDRRRVKQKPLTQRLVLLIEKSLGNVLLSSQAMPKIPAGVMAKNTIEGDCFATLAMTNKKFK